MKEYQIDIDDPDKEILRDVARDMIEGKVVAFPTDTVYGLGTSIYNEIAIQKIFRIKGRPGSKALIALIDDNKRLEELVRSVPDIAHRLMDTFWPGALTIIFPASDRLLPSITKAGNIGIRMPDSTAVRELARMAGRPLATTSANRTGFKSATAGYQVKAEIGREIDILLDGGRIDDGKESSIVDVAGDYPRILRVGAIKEEEIENILRKY